MKWQAACAYVEDHHRHHAPPQGHQFSLGVRTDAGQLVGVAIVGRPVNRHFDNGLTIEVTRVATDGTPNACSALYAAAWRTARSAGYTRAITYTQDGETGASLRAAGWRKVTDLPARPGWNTPNRPRRALGTENIARALWEITTHPAPALPEPCDETRDETRTARGHKRCSECQNPIPTAATGRPPRYCSPACRQRAYRRRQRHG
ncbi:XF1762 family protein [Streptomyces sp. NPDC001507]|uniref:XF1762 family protein n=1 Tax=Streptomyces sp. NPDC001507 TaxID=3364579 RepID=UPI0036BEA249